MSPALKAARERLEADLAIFDNPDAIPSGGIVVVRCRDLRTLLTALDEQEWRPIETLDVADHDQFDAWLSGGVRGVDCWRDNGRIWSYHPEGSGWHDITDLATHWRPLTAPPVEVKGP